MDAKAFKDLRDEKKVNALALAWHLNGMAFLVLMHQVLFGEPFIGF